MDEPFDDELACGPPRIRTLIPFDEEEEEPREDPPPPPPSSRSTASARRRPVVVAPPPPAAVASEASSTSSSRRSTGSADGVAGGNNTTTTRTTPPPSSSSRTTARPRSWRNDGAAAVAAVRGVSRARAAAAAASSSSSVPAASNVVVESSSDGGGGGGRGTSPRTETGPSGRRRGVGREEGERRRRFPASPAGEEWGVGVGRERDGVDDDDDEDVVFLVEEEEGDEDEDLFGGRRRKRKPESEPDRPRSGPRGGDDEGDDDRRRSLHRRLVAARSEEIRSEMDRLHRPASRASRSGDDRSGDRGGVALAATNPRFKKEGVAPRDDGLLMGWHHRSDDGLDPFAEKKSGDGGGTVWMEFDPRGGGGGGNHSLPPPPPVTKSRRFLAAEKRRVRRRRLRCVVVVAVVVAVSVSAAVGISRSASAGRDSHDEDDDASDKKGTSLSGWRDAGEQIAFSVTCDAPFDDTETESLSKHLADDVFPSDAEFVVHLGSVVPPPSSESESSDCDESFYENAESILTKSPAPTFVLPGDEDWTSCPNPERAFEFWTNHLGRFDETFRPSRDFDVSRDFDADENFAFLRSGVLFVGIHLIGGKAKAREGRTEWDVRNERNVRWTEENLFANYDRNRFRAVVIFGHAAPTYRQDDYFRPIADDVSRLGKPVLYVHANEGERGGSSSPSSKPASYPLFRDRAETFWAAGISKGGGKAPPTKVTVGFGDKRPYLFE